jgi:hypothetical protein
MINPKRFSHLSPTLYTIPLPPSLPSPSSPPLRRPPSPNRPTNLFCNKLKKKTPKTPEKMKIKMKPPFYSSILCHPFAEEERKEKWKMQASAEKQKINQTPT